MNRLFENYVAFMLKKQNPKISISTQVINRHLIKDERKDCFLMRPDILIRLKDKTIIADTKYKIIKGLGDISQADLYQVFAYAAKFKANEVWLIYPLLNDVLQGKTLEYKPEIFENKIKLKLLFAPLL